MADVIGKGVIEVSADATKLKAGIDDAKRSIKGLGESGKAASKTASDSIDRYVKRLENQSAALGKSTREAELHKLAMRGASDAQLKAADSALKLSENYAKSEAMGKRVGAGLVAFGALAVTGLIAAAVSFDALIKKAGDFQDMAEKTGDTAENIASLAVAAGTAGTAMDTIVGASAKLTKGLTGVDDESKAAGAAIAALGLNLNDFKNLKPADQLETVAKALGGFEDGAQKTAVAMALFGKSGADLMPFLRELGAEGGRQVILTAEQIRQADEYADKQAKLRTEISLTAQAIATQALPAISDFTGALSDTIKEILDVGKESTSLSGNSGVKTFADNAAISVAELVDAIYNASGALLALKGSLNVIAADSEVVIRAGSNALASMGPDFLYKRNTAALEVAIKEREATLKDANARYARLSQGAGMADKVRARIDARPGAANTALGQDAQELARRGRPQKTKKELVFDGADGKGGKGGKGAASAAGQEAKAQLAFDLEQIRKGSEAITGTFANAEKIMEARRSAALVSDKDYYASKLGFLNINSQAQEAELRKEIERLGQEKLTGKDKIDNLRKIAEAQAKLDKVRENAVANVEVLKTQEVAANAKIAQSYVDATTAAQAYIDTVNKQNAREISGVGKGNEFRANQAGRSAIEDKQTTQRQGLEGDLRRGQIDQAQFDTYLSIVNDTYAKEVAAYDARTIAIKEKQADWLNGATEAFANYQTSAEDVSGNTAAMFSTAFDSITDGVASSISSAILGGKSLEESLKAVALNVADAFITSFIKIQIQKLFLDKTAAAGYAATIAAQSQAMVAMAGLAAFASTAAIPIVGPALAPGAAAAATALAEGFAIAATASAALSVASARNGFDIPAGVNPLTQLHEKEMVLPAPQANVIRDLAKTGGEGKGGAITIVNNTSAKIGKVTEQRMSNGERALIIEEAVAATAAQFGDPNSKTSRALSRNYATQRSR